MTKFVIEKYHVCGHKSVFYKLYVNGEHQPDEFYEGLSNKKLKDEFAKILYWMEALSKGQEIPAQAHKQLKRNANDPIVDFEFRTSKLRVYYFRDEGTGNLITIAALKDDKKQHKFIEQMRRIKIEYINRKK